MAARVDGQSSRVATMVVTASGGGWNAAPCAMAVSICLNFTNPRAATIDIVAASMAIIRFHIGVLTVFTACCCAGLPPRVNQHARIHPVAVPCLLAEEARRVVLRLHRGEAIVGAQAPAAVEPLHAAAHVAREKRLRVVDAEA